MNKKFKLIVTMLVLGLCWSIVYVVPFIQYIFYDPFREVIGCTNAQLGLLMTVYGFGNIFGAPIGGWIADRFNYKKVYLASLLLNSIFSFLFVIKPIYQMAMMMWIGFAIASLVFNYPSHIKIVRGLVPDEDQGKIFGINESCVGIGNIIFNSIMMFLFTRFLQGTGGIKAAIVGIGCLSLVCLVGAWFVIEDPKKAKQNDVFNSEETEKMTVKDSINILKNPSTWMVGISIFTIYSFFTTMSYFTPYFTDVLGVTVVFSGVVAIVRTYGMTLFGAPIGGTLTDKLKSPSKVLLGVNILGILGLIVLLNLNKSVSPTLLICLTLIMSFAVYVGRGSYYAVITEVNIPKRYTASTIGIAAALGFSPDVFQFILFGHWLDTYHQRAYTFMFIYQLIVLTLGIFVAIWILKNKHKMNVIENKPNKEIELNKV
ncbi:MFS transporter [Clostridioides difficile]|uniref:MFS transporter n=1 Tax=Clostridioides difficile TaxID=1496 RepID=UPI000C9AB9D0|nr:MFS transporter [Clostridioides difficile]MBH6948906.1 MFS transporter [Clostridioides difficile]MDI3072983.1 MFS transporter [Clostridioides difficile]MDK3167360.1 MFS transporter [Clostridioides difficile]NMU15909.1 MFS transporter [Clostridioides difficile]